MAERERPIIDPLLQPNEIFEARLRLNWSRAALAEALLLSAGNGADRVRDWEEGKVAITGPASQAIRLWLAVDGLAPRPRMPFRTPAHLLRAARREKLLAKDTKSGVPTYADPMIVVTPEMIAAGLDALFLLDPDDSYEVVASLLTEIFTRMALASVIPEE